MMKQSTLCVYYTCILLEDERGQLLSGGDSAKYVAPSRYDVITIYIGCCIYNSAFNKVVVKLVINASHTCSHTCR